MSTQSPKFRVLIHGMNFQMRGAESNPIRPMGFYVNAFVEAVSPDEAELIAVELLRAEPKLLNSIRNPQDDPPRMFTEEILEIKDWPEDCARPLSGFVFYDDSRESVEPGE